MGELQGKGVITAGRSFLNNILDAALHYSVAANPIQLLDAAPAFIMTDGLSVGLVMCGGQVVSGWSLFLCSPAEQRCGE